MTRQSHARRWYSRNWGVLVCKCGAVGHEELHGNLLAWHVRHKAEQRVRGGGAA